MRMDGGDGRSAPEIWPSYHERRRLTRRALLGSSVGVTGAILGSKLLEPGAAAAANPHTDNSPSPTTNKVTPVPGGPTFSLTFPGPGVDPSSITDFNGFVGFADVQGTGLATNPDGSTETLLFDTDMRFMTGTYVGKDGHNYNGAFGFV
jgi:hypothetical protein